MTAPMDAKPQICIVRCADCFEKWANDNAFWEKQPYGNRFYFGDGAFDYVNRGVLQSAVKQLNQAKTPASLRTEEAQEVGE